jgi:hypothetical protein
MEKNMMFRKIFGALLCLLGIGVAIFTVNIGLRNQNALPVLVETPVTARQRLEQVLDSVCSGDYDTAGTMIYGDLSFGVDSLPEDPVSLMFWNAFQESLSYTLEGELYTTREGLAQKVRVTGLDFSSVTATLRERSQHLLEQRVADAEDMSEIYDENNEYREELVMSVLYEAAQAALAEDAEYPEKEIIVNVIYRQGQWWIVADDALLDAVSGGIAG